MIVSTTESLLILLIALSLGSGFFSCFYECLLVVSLCSWSCVEEQETKVILCCCFSQAMCWRLSGSGSEFCHHYLQCTSGLRFWSSCCYSFVFKVWHVILRGFFPLFLYHPHLSAVFAHLGYRGISLYTVVSLLVMDYCFSLLYLLGQGGLLFCSNVDWIIIRPFVPGCWCLEFLSILALPSLWQTLPFIYG